MAKRIKKSIQDNKEKPTQEKYMGVDEKLKQAREKRIRLAGLSVKKIEENNREEFRKYFTRLKRQLNLSSDLENIMWLHFKASGFDKKSKFEDGVKHFGYKL